MIGNRFRNGLVATSFAVSSVLASASASANIDLIAPAKAPGASQVEVTLGAAAMPIQGSPVPGASKYRC